VLEGGYTLRPLIFFPFGFFIYFLVSLTPATATEIFIHTENDLIFDTDEEFTGGAGFGFDYRGFTLSYQYRLFTPQNTSVTVPVAGQRPYAGYEKYGGRYRDNLRSMYYELGLYGARTGDKLHGEFIQNTIHSKMAKDRKEDPAQALSHGWPTQISNKTGGQGDLKLGFFHEAESGFSILFYGTGETGSFIRQAGYGVTSRMGVNPDKFSDSEFSPKNALYLEADLQHNHISKQALLEGNERDYPYAVEIEDKVAQASLSLIYIVAGIKLLAGVTWTSDEYTTQPNNNFSSEGHFYGTAGLGYRW
jgi:hypothetical protein